MTQAFEFYIDIEDAAGNKLGPGPITSAAKWTYTARADRAGSFSLEMPAQDPKASLVQRKRKARAWALLKDGVWSEVGSGIIDNIQRSPGDDGLVWLTASGDGELRELANRSVGLLDLAGGGAGVTHAAALSAIGGAVATGWTLTPASSPANNYIYGRFAGESVLSALVAVASKTQTHFYRSGPRAVTFASAFTSSGVRAIQAAGDLVPETAAIVDLTEQIDTFDLITRIVPLGAGNGDARLTLAASSRAAPGGYTLNKPANYLQHNASVTSFGVIDAPWIEFKDVRPISNTDADLQAAADMLFDQALKELNRRALDMQVATYAVTLAGCTKLLRPLQSLRLVYRDIESGIDVDRDLNILAATWEVDADGIQTTAVELSSSDLWPQSDVGAVVERITEGTVYQAHPQLNANAYVISYTKHLDDAQANPAQFRFRFDQEVTQLTRVCFDFQLLPLESTVKSISSSTPTSGASGDHTHDVTIAGHTHTVTIAGHTHTVTLDPHTHSVTIAGHTHTVTIPNHDHDVTIAGHQHSVTIAGHQHDVTILGHTHTITLIDHTHAVTLLDHSHGITLFDHTHGVTIPGHQHTVTISDHSHGVTFPNHEHDVPDHQHELGASQGSGGRNVGLFTGGGLYYEGSDAGVVRLRTTNDTGRVTTEDGGGATGTSGGGGGSSPTTPAMSSTVLSTGGGGNTTTSSGGGGGTTVSSTGGGLTTGTASSGGGTTVSSTSGGGSTPTTTSGGSSTPTTTSGGGSTPTTTSGGGVSTTSGSGGGLETSSSSGGSATPTSSSGGGQSPTSASGGTHTHSVTAVVNMEYGVFRDVAGSVFALGDLEYSVDGMTWYFFIPGVNGYTSLGGGWHRVDLTGLTQNPVNFRPLASNNLLQIRRKVSGNATKKATIDAQMSIRTVIQSISFV